jgi:hypothetical protein
VHITNFHCAATAGRYPGKADLVEPAVGSAALMIDPRRKSDATSRKSFPAIEPKPDPARPRPSGTCAKTAAALPVDAPYGLGERLQETDRQGGQRRSSRRAHQSLAAWSASLIPLMRRREFVVALAGAAVIGAGDGAGTTRKNLAHWISDARLLVLDGVAASL